MCTFGRHEILALSGREEMIYKMDSTTLQWSQYLSTIESMVFGGMRNNGMAIPESMNSIYAFYQTLMRIYDIPTKKWRIVSDIKLNNRGGHIEQCMFNVNNEIHFLGGDQNALHQIFDERNKQLVP